MDRFLLKRKSANKAEVEEVHVEDNLAAPTTKRNNVRVFKFNKKWKDGRPWLSLEDGKMFCSYCKVFDKTSRNKFITGCESMRMGKKENKCLNYCSAWMLVETGKKIFYLSPDTGKESGNISTPVKQIAVCVLSHP